MQNECVPTKGMKIGIAVLIAHFPLLIYAQHIALEACFVNQQVANGISALMAAFALGFSAYQVKRRRSIFGQAMGCLSGHAAAVKSHVVAFCGARS